MYVKFWLQQYHIFKQQKKIQVEQKSELNVDKSAVVAEEERDEC